ncbi:hypothetical protein Vadar_014456 [Vaccinium darrowii]|uniref:Uncharacterized protein n=1 Tax=Vaccinium darrowii TaxID=229202 RepID=A0ACB7Z5B8_9ERIC|nr:hypothetical protein Vadar_014456 [Vaccinium darrowii]
MYGTSLVGRGYRDTDIVKSTRIKSMNLTNNWKLSDDCLAKLSSVCPSLEVLDVSYWDGITEKDIADFLKSSSKIRKLHISYCKGIKNIGNGFELSKLDYVGATRSGINDDGLVAIGNIRCPGLLNLNVDGCFGVTTAVEKEILTNCERLRKINLSGILGHFLFALLCFPSNSYKLSFETAMALDFVGYTVGCMLFH